MSKQDHATTREFSENDLLHLLIMRVILAKAYHDQPTRISEKKSSGLYYDCQLIANAGGNTNEHMWQYLIKRLTEFWRNQTQDSYSKYKQCGDWLNILDLWNTKKTFDEANMPYETQLQTRYEASAKRLKHIPRGTLFENVTVPPSKAPQSGAAAAPPTSP